MKKKASKKLSGDRIGQVVTVIAVAMAAGYIALRIVGWARFAGV
jgi:hypothetical protein